MEHQVTQFRKWIRINAQNGVFFVKNNDGLALTASINQAKGYITIKTVTGYGVSIASDSSAAEAWHVFNTLKEAQEYVVRKHRENAVTSTLIDQGVCDDCQG